MASAKTESAYRAEAIRKIERAQARYPHHRPLQALFEYVTRYPDNLTPNTTRLWKQQMKIAVIEVAKKDPSNFSDTQIDSFIETMNQAIERLRGVPEMPRTATKKRKDPSKSEVEKVFGHLKTRALELHRVRMATTAIYCVLMPRLGGRPVELVGATVADGILTFPNAKRASEQTAVRQIDVRQWTPHYRVALAALIDMVNLEVQEGGYEAWLSIIAETLARACQTVGVARLAPSCFRHTALSTWSAAGFSAIEIARLAGHFCERSASHYIKTASAWGPEDANVAAMAPAVPSPAVVKVDSSCTECDFEPMPQPTPARSSADRSQQLQQDYRSAVGEYEKTLYEAVKRTLTVRRLRQEANNGIYRPVTGRPKL